MTHFSLLVLFFVRFPNFHLKIIHIYNTLVFVVVFRRFSWYAYPNFTNILYLSTNLYSSLSYCGCDQVTNFQSAGSNLTNDTLWQEGVLTVLLLSRTLTSKAFEVAKYRFAAKCKVSKYRPCCIFENICLFSFRIVMKDLMQTDATNLENLRIRQVGLKSLKYNI